jgi:outer membrane protein TolC
MREMIAAASENLESARHFQRLSEARMGVGQSNKIDVLRARLRVMDAEKDLANAKDGYEKAKIALARLVGIEERFDIVDPEAAAPISGKVDELTERALENRVELEVAALDREIAERSETEAWMQWLPAFDATYAWNWSSAGGLADANDSWMLIFGAKWDLFMGGSRIAEIKSRKSSIRMAGYGREQLVQDIRQEVEQGYLNVKQQRRNLELAGEQVRVAEQNEYFVTRQYEVGMASSLDLVNAAGELSDKRIAMVLDRLEYDIAVLTLRKAVGGYHALATIR